MSCKLNHTVLCVVFLLFLLLLLLLLCVMYRLYDGKILCDFANEVKSGAVSELVTNLTSYILFSLSVCLDRT